MIINKKSSQTATQKTYRFPWILQERQGLSYSTEIAPNQAFQTSCSVLYRGRLPFCQISSMISHPFRNIQACLHDISAHTYMPTELWNHSTYSGNLFAYITSLYRFGENFYSQFSMQHPNQNNSFLVICRLLPSNRGIAILHLCFSLISLFQHFSTKGESCT